jgi:hypothetical protein
MDYGTTNLNMKFSVCGMLSNLEHLWKLLTFIQDELVPVQTRVGEGLKGEYYVRGIGKNILTALPHTFFPDKYRVWGLRENA